MSEATEKIVELSQPTKRRQIEVAAMKLFLDTGFEETSMDAIASEANVSKRTVYSHFPNKESLFLDVMKEMCNAAGEDQTDLEDLDTGLSPREFLTIAGRMSLNKVTDPRVQAIMRSVIKAPQAYSELGQGFWEKGPGSMHCAVRDYLSAATERGDLSVADPELAAIQFMVLSTGPHFLPMIFTGSSPWGIADIDRLVEEAVDAFLLVHAPSEHKEQA